MTNDVPKIVQNDSYLKPFTDTIKYRMARIRDVERQLTASAGSLSSFANGHNYFGLHRENGKWVFREWAPNATEIFLLTEACNWRPQAENRFRRLDDNGVWELVLPFEKLKHLDFYKFFVRWPGGEGERIPSYANYVVQDEATKIFCARVWAPEKPYEFKNKAPREGKEKNAAPLIYEAHVGMAQIEGKVSSYDEFRVHTLPRIVKAGYNTVQLMAIQEHPYYGSFGYQVSNFFAPSSRFGSPDDLKRLIDEAHGLGLSVIMDIVHSHAVKNELEGLSRFDGTTFQYFHDGGRGNHDAWDTRCFDYLKPQVMHFLLSNCKYWVDEFKFDGFRFDGVTSMLYLHHGLGKGFSSYYDYFNHEVDEGALIYLALANKLIHEVRTDVICIAEDMSGMPGLAVKLDEGGIGFDYRLAMGIPDYWIRLLKEKKDEDWHMEGMWHELTNRRRDEKVISYAESHDQALVGDKTLIFWLLDKEMYDHMQVNDRTLLIDRGIALHKLIRMVTLCTARGGYLNFMGNEFGHPEWIDFPREGNGWSYHYARRQWHLRDAENLCYKYLADFDKSMIELVKDYDLGNAADPKLVYVHCDDHVLCFERAGLLFLFNFDPVRSYTDYMFYADRGRYVQVFNSDNTQFGGFDRIPDKQIHETLTLERSHGRETKLSVYLPSRSVQVLKKMT